MGVACDKGFESAFCRVNVVNTGNVKDVRSNNGENWDKNIQCTKLIKSANC